MTGDEALQRLREFQKFERKERGKYVDLQRLQIRYGFECFFRRLAKTSHRSDFVLKGAMLLVTLSGSDARNTKDADFQVHGPHTPRTIRTAFAEICSVEQDDGLSFLIDEIEVHEAGSEREYPGYEVTVPATLGSSKLTLRFDVGFGEAITPGPQDLSMPVLLRMPKPNLRAYPWETVIAEKFEALVSLGMRNNRMKDFYDVADLADRIKFDADVLSSAIRNTFEHRQTALPISRPIALTKDFYGDRRKRGDWGAFLTRHSLPKNLSLEECCRRIEAFLMPIVESIKSD